MKTKVSPLPKLDLVGHFFHSLKDGKIHWQGRVVGHPEPGIYLVVLFEWLMGEPNVEYLVRVNQMMGWMFYPDQETMIHSYKHGVARGKRADCGVRDEEAAVPG